MPTFDELPERLNWRQACGLLGCTKSTLYRMAREGVLPAYGVGRRCRWYLRRDCEKILLQRSNGLDKSRPED